MNQELKQTKKHLGMSVILNILLIIAVVSGLAFIMLGAPTQYFTGSAFTRPQIVVEDVKKGAFVVEYLKAFEEQEVVAGTANVNIGEFNLKAENEPIDINSLNFVFEDKSQELLDNLVLKVDGKGYKDVEFVWINDSTLSLLFSAQPLVVKDEVSIEINSDLTNDLIEGEIIMHFSYADLVGEKTKETIENQGIVNDKPDPKPQTIIIK